MRYGFEPFSRLIALCCLLAFVARPSGAQSLLNVGFLADRAPLFEAGRHSPSRSASLFEDGAETGLFTPLPRRLDAPLDPVGRVAMRLRDLIAKAEAGPADYDAVQLGARIKPPKPPTAMTLAEIQAWTTATPGQPHAIGRYQFIPPTLRHSAKRLGLSPETRFSPTVQDQLADLLLSDAGLHKVTGGNMSIETFMLNLAKIWAGLPVPSGRSYYEGVAGNKAVLSHEHYARKVRKILGG